MADSREEFESLFSDVDTLDSLFDEYNSDGTEKTDEQKQETKKETKANQSNTKANQSDTKTNQSNTKAPSQDNTDTYEIGDSLYKDTANVAVKEPSNNNKNNSNKRGGAKSIKTALTSVGIGTVLLVIGLASANALGTKDRNKGNQVTNSNLSNTTAFKETESSTVENKNNANNSNTNQVTQQDTSGWIEISDDTVIDNTYTIDATMTVTDIKYYAYISSSNTRQIKAEVTGNLSGLVGIYRINIPYDKATMLNNGDAFSVSVTLCDKEGYKVVLGIDY